MQLVDPGYACAVSHAPVLYRQPTQRRLAALAVDRYA